MLLIASVLLAPVAGLGLAYMIGAGIVGAGFLVSGVALAARRSNVAARRVFFSSLLYLPLLLAIVVADRLLSS
jgi:heme O synthase-like polyprenyltransferase